MVIENTTGQICEEPLCMNHIFVEVEHAGARKRVCFEHYRQILKWRDEISEDYKRWKRKK